MNTDVDSKKKRFEFIILLTLVIITRVFDLLTTYLLTPDLSYESNPFITLFGLGWYGFIIIQLLISMFVIAANYYSIFKAKIEYPSEKDLTFDRFQLYYMFGRGIKEKKTSLKLWGVLKVNTAFIGYLLPRVLILFSTFIIIIHILLYFGIIIPQYYLYTFYFALLFCVVLFNKLNHRALYRDYKCHFEKEPEGLKES